MKFTSKFAQGQMLDKNLATKGIYVELIDLRFTQGISQYK